MYRAVDRRTGATVVLKRASAAMLADRAFAAKYRRELDVARRVDHQGVQRALPALESRSEPYLVLEYVEGRNLCRVIRTEQPVPVVQVLRWAIELAGIVEYLHSIGVSVRGVADPERVARDAATAVVHRLASGDVSTTSATVRGGSPGVPAGVVVETCRTNGGGFFNGPNG